MHGYRIKLLGIIGPKTDHSSPDGCYSISCGLDRKKLQLKLLLVVAYKIILMAVSSNTVHHRDTTRS